MINGATYNTVHPWGEDITHPAGNPFVPGNNVSKCSTGVGTASRSINWRINIGGSWMARSYPNGGPITVVDTIQDGQELPALSTIVMYESYPHPDTALPGPVRSISPTAAPKLGPCWQTE